MPSELKDIFVYPRHLQRAGLLLPLPLSGRCSTSPKGGLQFCWWPTRRIQHFWWLQLSYSALNCKNKAYTYSFMLFFGVLQCASSSHRDHWHMAVHLLVWLSLRDKQCWSSGGSAISGVQCIPYLSSPPTLWSCWFVVQCFGFMEYHGND